MKTRVVALAVNCLASVVAVFWPFVTPAQEQEIPSAPIVEWDVVHDVSLPVYEYPMIAHPIPPGQKGPNEKSPRVPHVDPRRDTVVQDLAIPVTPLVQAGIGRVGSKEEREGMAVRPR